MKVITNLSAKKNLSFRKQDTAHWHCWQAAAVVSQLGLPTLRHYAFLPTPVLLGLGIYLFH